MTGEQIKEIMALVDRLAYCNYGFGFEAGKSGQTVESTTLANKSEQLRAAIESALRAAVPAIPEHPTAGKWFCEAHPDKAMAHDGCKGAGITEILRDDAMAFMLGKTRDALANLHALVWGECPSLLNDDSSGSADLDLEIRDLLEASPQAPQAARDTGAALKPLSDAEWNVVFGAASEAFFAPGCTSLTDQVQACAHASMRETERAHNTTDEPRHGVGSI